VSEDVKNEKDCMFYKDGDCVLKLTCGLKGDKCCADCIRDKVKCLNSCDCFN